MSSYPIQLSPPHFESSIPVEILSGVPETIIGDFEGHLADYIDRKYAVALNSGTSAIHLALKVLGIGKGDTVLCQSMTYAATAFPILYEGARPVFVDSESETWNMDPGLLRQSFRELMASGIRPKAILVVDLYGMPAKMNEILSMAADFEIPVIEDAAEALGAAYEGKRSGSFGSISILSFNSNKVMTCGGGGMVLTDDQSLAEKARYYASQSKDPGSVMNHREVGYNYRMNHVNAALGLQQLSVLEKRISHRREVFQFYQDHLNRLPGIIFLDEPEDTCSSRWLSTILIDPEKSGGVSRTDIERAMEAEKIESRPVWKPMHTQPVFAGCKAYVNGASEKLFEQGLCLPSGSNLTSEDLYRITSVIKNVFTAV